MDVEHVEVLLSNCFLTGYYPVWAGHVDMWDWFTFRCFILIFFISNTVKRI